MKKEIRTLVLTCLILSVILPGCTNASQETEQLFKSDTVVNIPLNPETTEAATEEATIPEETEVETEAATEATEETKATTSTKTTTTKSSSSKTTSSKTSSSTTSSTSKTTTKATEPPATQPPETQPTMTEPAQTEPPETQATEAPTAEAPETEVPPTEIPETEPPATQSPEEAVYDISDYAVGGLEYGIVEQINACRAEEGLDSLSMSGTLCGIASVRAYEVCLSWSHTRPNGSGWQSVLSDYGYGYGVAAEDLVYSAGFDAASIVSKWMGSDSSRADILNAEFTTIGVGVYNTDGTTFIAVIFAG